MNDQVKHGPKPWRKGARVPGRHAIRILDSEGLLVAEARAGGGPWSWAEVNAALIVAAVNACFAINPDNPLAVAEALPELVEACKLLVAWRDNLLEITPGSALDMSISTARAAIAKAKP